MSQENLAGDLAGVPEDFSAYEAYRQTGKLPEPEVKEPSEAEPEPEPEKLEPADGDADPADDLETEEEVKPEEPKKKSGAQRAREKAEKLQREIDELRQQVAGKKTAETSAGTPAAPQKPTLDSFLKSDKYETYEAAQEAFTDALTDYKLTVREQERAAAEQTRKEKEAQESAAKSWNDRATAFRKTAQDYDDVLESVEDVQLHGAVTQAITESDIGPKLAYELAKNRPELERIAKLSPVAAIREIGKLEAKLTTPEPAPKPKPAVSKAPDPPKPVGARSEVLKKPLAQVDDFSEYEKRRRAGERS